MATIIVGEECIQCGACEPECPNGAIKQDASGFYVITSELCTECVGFHEAEACAAVCPVDCCVPDPERPESEEQNYAKLAKVHPDESFPPLAELTADLSRFRKN